MKRWCLFFLLAVGSLLTASAEDYKYLVLTQTDASTIGFELRKTRSITFNGDAIVVTTTDGEAQATLSTLKQLDFTSKKPTGVQEVIAKGASGRVTIYSLNGVPVRQFDNSSTQNVSTMLSTLPAGMYIIKEGSQTRKLLKR